MKRSPYLQKALQLNPDDDEIHNNLGCALLQKGNVDEAILHFQKALQLNPDDADAHHSLGCALLQKGNVDVAILHFQKALQLKPDYPESRNDLGCAFLQKGNVDEAILYFQKFLQSKPDDAEGHHNLGCALLQKGNVDEAIPQFQDALKIIPDYPEPKNNLAWIFATSSQASLRNGSQAVELAQQANQLTGGKNPAILKTLAAAYAEAGQFSDATQYAHMATKLAQAAGRKDLAGQINSELKLYEMGLPFHQESK